MWENPPNVHSSSVAKAEDWRIVENNSKVWALKDKSKKKKKKRTWMGEKKELIQGPGKQSEAWMINSWRN